MIELNPTALYSFTLCFTSGIYYILNVYKRSTSEDDFFSRIQKCGILLSELRSEINSRVIKCGIEAPL
jgi:hypothetical protein